MQDGSLTKRPRQKGPDVWEFRWREPGPMGTMIHRRMVIGTVEKFPSRAEAIEAVAGLKKQINGGDPRVNKTLTVLDLVEHFRQQEMNALTTSRSFSTQRGYEGNLKKWILPRWGSSFLHEIRPFEVESWLRQQRLAAPSSAKIRDVFRLLFNHGCRYGLTDSNPIVRARASKKRQKIPDILTFDEAGQLINVLEPREKLLVLIALGNGLRRSELFALKWMDLDFEKEVICVMRSIVYQVVGPCKTETSRKPVPLHPIVSKELSEWREQSTYREPEDWIFASPTKKGTQPYWGSNIMTHCIRAAAKKVGITKRIGWHTFRRTYCSWLKYLGTDIKVMQELLRHASVLTTLNGYAQAMTPAKRAAQNGIMALLFGAKDESQQALVSRLSEDLKMIHEIICQALTCLSLIAQTLPPATSNLDKPETKTLER